MAGPTTNGSSKSQPKRKKDFLSETDTDDQSDTQSSTRQQTSDSSEKLRHRGKELKSKVEEKVKRGNVDRKLAFLTDEQIASGWLWKVFDYLVWPGAKFLHAFEVDIPDPEPVDRTRGILTVTMHSTHNTDIFAGVSATYKWSGRIPRGMVHRLVMKFAPWFAYLGCVPGDRYTAIELLKQNYWVAAVPGGAEEALTGHENSYKIDWPDKRKGFAKVAKEAGAPIVPIFFENVEEMRWNPVFWVWHILRLYVVFHWLVNKQIPYLSKGLKTLGEALWFQVSFMAIPVPVKVIAHIGNPIHTKPDSDIDDLVRRTREELQRMIKKYQPDAPRKNYWRGIKMRWQQPRRGAFKNGKKIA